MDIVTVQNGDSIYKIARQYGTTPTRIVVDNALQNPARLSVGETLIVTRPEEVYTVRTGDTLTEIAARYGVSLYRLWQNNPILMGRDRVFPGQQLVIRYEGEDDRRTIAVNGYAYPFIDRDVLRQTLPFLTYLSVFTYGLRPDGTLIEPEGNEEEIISLALEYGTRPLMMLTSLTEAGTFSNELVSQILRNPSVWETLGEALLREIQSKGYTGLDVDFEYISADLADDYVAFLETLQGLLAAEGYPLFVSVAPKTSDDQPGLLYEGHSYSGIGSVADFVLLMTYEWGYLYGPPLPVSPIREVERVVQYAVTRIPPEKLLLGVPNYAYDWALPFRRGSSSATALSNVQAVERAKEKNAAIQFDEETQTPFYTYYEPGINGAASVQHIVWFDNARSINEKLALVEEYGLYGLSVWNIMRYFPAFWIVLNSRYRVLKLGEEEPGPVV